ncbi:MAG TPA: sigma-70 family RNA polymerase sigma factor [Acidimicrobiales bacterium]|jgi:RNA polymerase sigma-70 factor (ECF subfamily)|nr:sigma-70 family RNA polymerase sigma factor [Acidimicrobiales bacterium]
MDDDTPSEKSAPTSGSTFEDLYHSHYDAVSRYVARRLPSSAHDEVVASTFVVAWRKFDAALNPSLPWLYRIASYEVAHERRRVGREPAFAELNDLHLTDTHSLEDVMDVAAAFSQLSPNDAELLRLVHWERLSRADVAELLDCSVNAVNVRYHRALARFSSALHRHLNSSSERAVAKEQPKETP